ncbi:hypothetical protein AK88_05518 [Plasmodium fragile]|uniref:CD99 antigen n=1 Tax=Plasmodium fragile TaxID=5857 RepID=A0A0D9QCW2_PLAFR|nr:uncharacterized protein AK88_05518 [Plasmodium fragile]KJP84848.1 hypothetical protein AK88_05518 [Plasmodium fragile]
MGDQQPRTKIQAHHVHSLLYVHSGKEKPDSIPALTEVPSSASDGGVQPTDPKVTQSTAHASPPVKTIQGIGDLAGKATEDVTRAPTSQEHGERSGARDKGDPGEDVEPAQPQVPSESTGPSESKQKEDSAEDNTMFKFVALGDPPKWTYPWDSLQPQKPFTSETTSISSVSQPTPQGPLPLPDHSGREPDSARPGLCLNDAGIFKDGNPGGGMAPPTLDTGTSKNPIEYPGTPRNPNSGPHAPDLTGVVLTATTPVLFFLASVTVALLGYSLWKKEKERNNKSNFKKQKPTTD